MSTMGSVINNFNHEWKFISLPPDEHQVKTQIDNVHAELEMEKSDEFQVVLSCGKHLAKILTGEDNALRILFPEDPNAPSAAKFYAGSYARREVFVMASQVLRSYLERLNNTQQQNSTLRILEIGAGTGSFTEQLTSLLEEQGIAFEYTYTDISPAFFVKARSKFEKYKKNMIFKPLNIEMDPAGQGFCPGYYDIVVAGDVIHATESLAGSVNHVRKLIRPNGSFWLLECTLQCREITFVFGLLEGYWCFKDKDIRQDHAIVSGDTWEKIMKKSNFSRTQTLPCFMGYNSLIFGKASNELVLNTKPLKGKQSAVWLLFINQNWKNSVSKLENLLMLANKTPILVEQSEYYCFDSDSRQSTIRPSSKSDITQLIAQFTKGNDCVIEGVIYEWGLVSSQDDTTDQASISQPYLYLIQALTELSAQKPPKLFTVSEGIIPTGGDYAVTLNPASGTLWGITKSFHNEYPSFPCRCIDLSVDDPIETKMREVFSEIWMEDSETMVAYRENKRLCARLASTSIPNTDITLPASGDRFQLILPETKTFSDLKFGPLPKYILKPNEIEIQIKATALNFRDVFTVLKPSSQFESINSVGLDIAGVVSTIGSAVTKWKVGDSVFGTNLDGCLPSHVCLREDAVVALPTNLTYAEAATIPAVFSTVYYGLKMVANLKAGETVLIHTASGGVGLSAIQYAQYIGANIIATAGSHKKRSYLRKLGIQHVFHSRNTKYEEEIMKVTGGNGVDVVLNSLTGPGFKEASLNVCAKHARFVEMSKLSIWKPEEVHELRPDVEYTIIDLTTCSEDIFAVINGKMDEYLKNGIVRPIPYKRFDAVNVGQALNYLQKAKHIGKVVCIMPEITFENGRRVVTTPLFNNRSTYILTGGLGGIGLEVAKWMCTQGAKNLILVGRSQPSTAVAEVIQQMNSGGLNVFAYSADIGSFAQCKDLMEFIKTPENNLPPLRGIMHLAGVLRDAILSNQTWDKYEATYNAKVKGTLNLHQLTLQENLEHFVMYSSIAGLFGSPGQSNHAASNAFLDAFTHFRESQGLVATSVNWGAWGQVGVAAGMEIPGFKPFSPQRGIQALDKILREYRTQLCVTELQLTVFQKFFESTHTFLEDVLYKDADRLTKASKQQSGVVNSEKFWHDLESAESSEDKINVIKDNVKIVIREILKLEQNEPIDDTSSFQDMGLDSLMMVEMKNLLQGILGKRVALTANDLKDCNSITLIAHKLSSMISGQAIELANNVDDTPMSADDWVKLMREDCQLSSEICHKESNAPPVSIENCRTFLITGVTGNLAPYFIRDIFKHTTVSKVYCLVRAKSNEHAGQRLRSVLKDKDLLDSVDLTRISCVAGDLAKEKFGLDAESYNHLSKEVDAIIHSVVKASHIEPYRKSSAESTTDIRTVNVQGTLRILEFAVHNKTKHVLHSSTMLAVSILNKDGALSDDWPNMEDFDGITQLGYPVSKFVCDLLMKEAVLNRGIPCKVFRFPAITGESQTGRFSYQNNHFLLRLLSYLRVGAMPSLPVPINVVPVDTCANIALKIFFSKEAPSDMYNVCQLKPYHEQEFVSVAKEMGYNVDVVEFPEFVKKLEEEGEGSLLYSLRDLYMDEDKYTSLFFSHEAIQGWFINQDGFFHSKKLVRYAGDLVSKIPSMTEIIKKDLTYAKNEGVFEKLGVK